MIRAAAAALWLATMAAPAAAHAQDDGGPALSDDARAELEHLRAEAEAHTDAEEYALAAQSYMQLHDAMAQHSLPRAPVALWGAGFALSHVPERASEARDTLQRFLDESTALQSESDVAGFRSRAVALVAELDARIGSGNGNAGAQETRNEGAGHGATSTSGTMSPIGPIVLAGGILVVAAGAVLGALALNDDNSLYGRCEGTDCLNTVENHSLYDEMRTLSVAADVLLVGGGLITVGGIILTLTVVDRPATSPGPTATLRVGFGQVSLGGQF